jgi:hypothetical protein
MFHIGGNRTFLNDTSRKPSGLTRNTAGDTCYDLAGSNRVRRALERFCGARLEGQCVTRGSMRLRGQTRQRWRDSMESNGFARDRQRTGWGYRTHCPTLIYALDIQHESRRMRQCTRDESTQGDAALRPTSKSMRSNQGTASRA